MKADRIYRAMLMISIVIGVVLAPVTSLLFRTFEDSLKEIQYVNSALEDYRAYVQTFRSAGWLDCNLKLFPSNYYDASSPQEAMEHIHTEFKKDERYIGMVATSPEPNSLLFYREDGTSFSTETTAPAIAYSTLKRAGIYPELNRSIMFRTYTIDEEIPLYLAGELAKEAPVGTILTGNYISIHETTMPRPVQIKFKVVGHVENPGCSVTDFYTGSDHVYAPWTAAIPVITLADGTPLVEPYESQTIKTFWKTTMPPPTVLEKLGSIESHANFLQHELYINKAPLWERTIQSFATSIIGIIMLFGILLYAFIRFLNPFIFQKSDYLFIEKIIFIVLPMLIYYIFYSLMWRLTNLPAKQISFPFHGVSISPTATYYSFWGALFATAVVIFLVIYRRNKRHSS